MNSPSQPHQNDDRPAIAITGMAGRFPGADNLDQFWQNLVNGVESLTHFSDQELLDAGIDPSWVSHRDYVKTSAVINQPGHFDAAFFGMSPREAAMTDPQHRLFLQCAWETLEDAGCDPDSFGGRVGVFAGVKLSEYFLFNHPPVDLIGLGTESPILNFQRQWATDKDYLATRVSYKLNLRGPSFTVQTACSTSLVAVHLACQSLASGESDLVLAGGVTIRLPPAAGYVHIEGGIFSPDGHTRAFDAQAAGTIWSSGVGVVALKRLDDALADGDVIRAVLRGTAINNDGQVGKTAFTRPAIPGQVAVIRAAQKAGGIEPDTIGYLEAHGTATAIGDPIEIASLTEVFRTQTQDKQFCALGSVKTNIGHTVQASGVAGLIKSVLMLESHPDVNEDMRRGDFSNILSWLRENVHAHGSKFFPQELMMRITGSKIDGTPYLGYLNRKYRDLYGI